MAESKANKASGQQIVPEEALKYWKRKGLQESWDYRDIWKSEHATAFTVAKTMQLDVLDDIHEAVEKAIAGGQSWETFKKDLPELLRKKGWWGKKKIRNPRTGKLEEVQLGSYRRLKTIYETNIQQAHHAGSYQQGMRSEAHPYIMYKLGPSVRHREEHVQWEGLCLPKDDPFWDTHHPMNGYGCKCWTQFISKQSYKEYKENGIPEAVYGKRGAKIGEVRREMITQRPEIEYVEWRNKKTGQLEKVPRGITPGFDWNPGSCGRAVEALRRLEQKAKNSVITKSKYHSYLKNAIDHPIQQAHYQSVVSKWYNDPIKHKQSSDYVGVGFLNEVVYQYAEKHGIELGESGLMVMGNRVMHKEKGHGAKGNVLELEEWQGLWHYFQNPVAIYWDKDKKNFWYVGKRKGGKLTLIIVGKRAFPRNHKPIYAIDEAASVFGEYKSLSDIENISGGNRMERVQ